jgi:5-methylcytosine-specific restriction endonuclease McrA
LISVNEWRKKNAHRRNAADRVRNAKNRKQVREYARTWAAANPEKVKEHIFTKNHNRRARIVSAIGRNTAPERRRLLDSYLGRCAYCFSAKAKHFDHVVPLSRGGSNDIDNLVPACAFCNVSKGNRSLLEFMMRKAA